MSKQIKDNLVLTGGGTLGSVVPLLALADDLRDDFHLIFIGTKIGPEKDLLAIEGLPFLFVPAGKLRRYWSWQNFFTPFLFLAGLVKSFWLLKKIKPKAVITAGSFVSVGVVAAAWLLRIPVLVHQLDYVPGLANKLMARLAKRITVSFKKSTKDYSEATWTGLPIRQHLFDHIGAKAEALKYFKLNNDRPVVLVLGGGTGASRLNRLITDNLYNLTQVCQLIHLTGTGKGLKIVGSSGYYQAAILDQSAIAKAYAAADLVVSRAGMGTLAELAYLAKPAIIIPMPDSHQEANAKVLAETQAAIVLNQKKLNSPELYRQIKEVLADAKKLNSLGHNLQKTLKTDANEEIIKIIKELVK